MPLERLQKFVFRFAVAFALLGLATSVGCTVVPKGPPQAAWLLHPVLLLLAAAGGWATLLRNREIDRRRWEIVEDPTLTSGEREYAHREAERERRVAATAFLLGPLTLGYWMAYQFNVEERITAADFLVVPPLAGYVLGLLVGRWKGPKESPPLS